jgi:IS30 family transposase
MQTRLRDVIYTRTCIAKCKRYLCGSNRRGQTLNRRPISERPAHIEQRKQVCHWKGDTVIDTAHKEAIVTLVERKSVYKLLIKVLHKCNHLVGRAIEDNFKN